MYDVELTTKEKILNIVFGILTILVIYGCILFAGAYEHHHRCLNGETQYCIPEDFE